MIKKNKKFNNTKKLSYKKNKKNSNKKNKTLKKKNYKLRGGNICKLLLNSNSLGSSPGSSSGSSPKSSPKSSPGSSLNNPMMSITSSHKYVEPNPLFYTGIKNIGSTCYMNASLQLLWSIPEIRRDIVNLHQADLYTQYATYDYRSQIVIILTAMFNTFYSKKTKNNKVYDDDNNLNNLTLTSLTTEGNSKSFNQEDAYDYLTLLLSIICDDNNSSNDCQILNLKQYIQYTQQITTTCKFNTYISVKEQIDLFFIIPLGEDIKNSPKQNTDIVSLIKKYSMSELVYGIETCFTWRNSNTTPGPGDRKINIKKTSNNILLVLSRFKSINTGQSRFLDSNKIKNEITPNNLIEIDSIRFILKGCILHLGDTQGGHYVYLVFDNNGSVSHIIDDSSVITDNINININEYNYLTDGYIYYYRRQTPYII